MVVTYQHSTSYRDGSIALTIETTTSSLKDGRGRVSKETYYLEINDETKRMNADEFGSLKRIISAFMGSEE